MTSLTSAGLLSVIIPNYNYARYIADTIVSVFRQDYDRIELVVVDDGSTDRSLETIREVLKRPNRLGRFELVKMPANSGKLAAINAGLNYCKGEYAIILDADDLLVENYASRCIAELIEGRKSDSQLGFIYSNCKLIDERGCGIAHGKSTAFDPTLIEHHSFIPEPALTLMTALKEAAPFDERIRKGTKHHKWRRIIANGWRGQHIAEPLFSYRMHGQNLSGIGERVMSEVEKGNTGERILSGYWPTAVASS